MHGSRIRGSAGGHRPDALQPPNLQSAIVSRWQIDVTELHPKMLMSNNEVWTNFQAALNITSGLSRIMASEPALSGKLQSSAQQQQLRMTAQSTVFKSNMQQKGNLQNNVCYDDQYTWTHCLHGYIASWSAELALLKNTCG